MKAKHTKELLHTDSTRILAKSGKIIACTEFADYSVEEAWANAEFITKACNAYADNQDTIAELEKAIRLMVETAAPSMIVNMALKQDDPVLEGLAMVLGSLLDKLKAALAKVGG